MPKPLRLTRDLVDRLPARVDERGPERESDLPPDYYETTKRRLLDELPADGQLWFFAIGSLIWKPKFRDVERRPAQVRGWQRAFCIGPDRRYRGCPSAPGLMLSLDRGGECQGIAMRMDPEGLAPALEELLRQEPPVPPSWVNAETAAGPVSAIAFTVDRDYPLYMPEPPLEDVADTLASSVGYIGSMAEYLFNTVERLAESGIHDPHLWQLQAMVAERLERLPPRTG